MAHLLTQIKGIEEEMSITQKNKKTNFHLGILKAKLAKLKDQLLQSSTSGKGGGKGEGFDVSKSGDSRIGLVGFPSVGKSTLLNKLTNTFSEVAAYEFTTLTCVPGVINYKGAKLQLLDLPGIIEGAKDGKGRGRQVISTARTCNLILVILDAGKPVAHKKKIVRELEGFGIRLNKLPAEIMLKKKDKGGINMMATVPLTNLDTETVKAILKEYKINNCDVVFHCDATVDELIDAIEGNRVYIPAIFVLNKIDSITIEELDILDRLPNYCPVSAEHEWNLDTLLKMMWESLKLMRIYTKPKGQLADFSEPVILKQGKTNLTNFCTRIHKSLLKEFKYAWVWGSSVKHNPQKVGLSHILDDEDIVQIVKK